MPAIATVDEYIAQFSAPIQSVCRAIQQTIRETAPEATEKISYGLATFYQGENLVHFGVMKKHIGFYPGGDGVSAFADRLASYSTSKGAIRFPIDQPIPLDLVREITAYRVQVAKARHNPA